MTARKIILDCDPGHDDAVAILLAAGNPAIELVGITTIGGNQTLDKVTHNARTVCTIAGLVDVPLYPGCTRPLLRAPRTAGDIHGDSGMDVDGYDLPAPTVDAADGHAVDFIIDTVMAHEPGEITLVPIGPLTNIALAVRKEPRIVDRVKEVVLMGGGYHEANASAVAEFNIIVDPEAAKIVFNEPWQVTMVGLDLTHQALATSEIEAEVAAVGGQVADSVVALFGSFREAYRANQGFEHPPVHDPCAVAYLIDPTVVDTLRVPVDVEITGALTSGMTVADFRAPASDDCHTQVATKLDHRRFWDLVIDAVKALS